LASSSNVSLHCIARCADLFASQMATLAVPNPLLPSNPLRCLIDSPPSSCLTCGHNCTTGPAAQGTTVLRWW
ncbi:hypothetical protein CLOM_g7645, partial [Closterium sp. NIES-68]